MGSSQDLDIKEKDSASSTVDQPVRVKDGTHRQLKGRHAQLIATGGAIGTVLFVQLGFALPRTGPGGLLVAFLFWSTVMIGVNNSMAEMVSWMPISSPFARFASQFVDPALGTAIAFSFFLCVALGVAWEITAIDLILQFWTDKIPFPVVFVVVLGSYILFNIFAVQYFGEAEFWLALGKIILALGLILFTFVVMVGGNPAHDAFGFRNWDSSKVPGTPFATYIYPGSAGRLVGFLYTLGQTTIIFAGPEFLAITAGEVENPRKNLPRSFKYNYLRLMIFYVLGALSVGILLPYNDPLLLSNMEHPKPGAGSSPYVLAMQRLNIKGLPHVVNAMIMLSAYSAGNGYMYSASRLLLGLGLENNWTWLCKCTKKGVPIYCVAIVAAWGCLSLLQLSNSGAKVLGWFANVLIITTIFPYAGMLFSYIRFKKALKLHGIKRETLPYAGFFQPVYAYYSFTFIVIVLGTNIYTSFLEGKWSIGGLFVVLVIGLLLLIFFVWKIRYSTKLAKLEDIDFFAAERKVLDEEDALRSSRSKSRTEEKSKPWFTFKRRITTTTSSEA